MILVKHNNLHNSILKSVDILKTIIWTAESRMSKKQFISALTNLGCKHISAPHYSYYR